MKRWIRLLPVFALGLSVAGCWNYRDINDRSLVLGLAVDRGADGEHLSSLELLAPIGFKGGGGGGGGAAGGQGAPPRFVISGQAETSPEALSRLRTQWRRPFDFGHLTVLLLGEAYARRGAKDEFGCVGCHPEMSVGINVLAVSGRAGNVLAGQPPGGGYMSLYLDDLLLNALDRGSIPATQTVSQVVAETESTGIALLPRLSAVGGMLRLEGAAILKDYRLIGWVEEPEVRGLNFLRGKGRRGLVEVSCPDQGQEKMVFLTVAKRSRLEITGEERPSFRYRINVSGVMMNPTCPKGEEEIPQFETVVEREIRALALSTVRRAQEMGVDFLGLGQAVQRKKPALWRSLDWQAEFPRVPVAVEVQAKVQWHSMFGVRARHPSVSHP